MAGGWLSSSPIIRSSQLGKPADRLPGETNSPGAGGVGGVAGCSDAGCVGIGVGKVVAKGGTAVDTGATGVGAALDPQARLSTAIAERIDIRMDSFMAGFM